MDYPTRALLDRIELYDTHGRVGRDLTARGGRILTGLTLLWTAIALALVYAAIQVFDGWGHAVVIGVLVMTFVAAAGWSYTLRPANPLPQVGEPSRGCSGGSR